MINLKTVYRGFSSYENSRTQHSTRINHYRIVKFSPDSLSLSIYLQGHFPVLLLLPLQNSHKPSIARSARANLHNILTIVHMYIPRRRTL